jgi:hypothetical protein
MRFHRQQPPVFLLLTTILPVIITFSSFCIIMSGASKVSEFAARPLIQRCLAKPMEVHSVLSFFFGVDLQDAAGIEAMRQGTPFRDMTYLWFMGGTEYDQLCQPFRDTVRSVPTLDWNHSVDEVMAKLICSDQLARNIFRGSSEAFQYEEPALDAARDLSHQLLAKFTLLICNSL